MAKVFWAHGYAWDDAKDELGFRSGNEKTWVLAMEKLGVNFSVVASSEDILGDLYGEYRLDKNLKFFLLVKRVGQSTAAVQTGISISEINHYIRGTRKPNAYSVRILSMYFSADPVEMLFGVPEIRFRLEPQREDKPCAD